MISQDVARTHPLPLCTKGSVLSSIMKLKERRNLSLGILKEGVSNHLSSALATSN